MNEVTFLLTSKLCPLGAVCPCPGAIYMYKVTKKNCINSDFKEIFLKLATNDRSDKMFLLTSKFRPQGVVSPCPEAIYMYKILKKNCINSDFKEILFSSPEPSGSQGELIVYPYSGVRVSSLLSSSSTMFKHLLL